MEETLVFDRAELMRHVGDDEELCLEMIAIFLEDVPELLAALQAALQNSDAVTAEREAHSLKGAAAAVGATRLRDLAFELEKNGKAGELDKMKALIGELGARIEEFKEVVAN